MLWKGREICKVTCYFQNIVQGYFKVHLVGVADFDTQNKVQDAFYDIGILCVPCDISFSDYESYLAHFLKAELDGIDVVSQHGFQGYRVDRLKVIDHHNLRMALLIMVWRCSISNRDPFSKISLGDLEEGVKSQIRERKTKSYAQLPVLLISMKELDDIRMETALSPVTLKWHGSNCIMLFVAGWMIIYCLSGSSKIDLFRHALNDSGIVDVVHFSHELGLEWMNKITGLEGNIRKSTFAVAKR